MKKHTEALKEIRAILLSGSHGDGTWIALSPEFRKILFEIADEALETE